MTLSGSLFLMALLMGTSAFFSAAEISLAAARRLKLQQLMDEGDPRARRVLAVQDQPGLYFTTVQIGINAVAIAGGIVGEGALTPYWMELLGASHLVTDAVWLERIAFGLSFSVVTALFILLADLMPRQIGMSQPEVVAMRLVGPMLALCRLLHPLAWVFTRISSALFALLGLPAQRDERVTHHDILAMTQAGTDAGVLAQQEQQVIENVFELDTRTVESAMTSRERVVFLLVDDSEESIRQQIAADPHSTYVVCQESIDHVVGYVDSADLFQRVLTGESILLRGPSAEGLLQRVLVVPDRLTLSEMLKQFRQAHEDFAVIVNEYSLVVGVITLNDVMSTVMGDLVAPHEVEQQIIRRDDGTWLVDGVTPVVDVQRMLGIEDWPHAGQYDTVAGFLMVMLRRIPRRTDHVQLGPWRFEVVDVDSYRIDQVLVSQKPAASVDPSAGGGLSPSLPPPN